MSEIKFACPHCAQHVACDDAYCGAQINCPGCGREMFVPRRAAFAPKSSGNLALELPVASAVAPHVPPAIPSDLTDEQWGAFAAGKSIAALSDDRAEINWPIFFGVLLAPALLTLLGMAAGAFELVMFATFIGSGLAGITCVRMLARRFGLSAVLVTVFAVVFAAASFVLCFVGCVAGVGVASQFRGH